jgi:pimeloyl-ACP methyl ester carboxylesterase
MLQLACPALSVKELQPYLRTDQNLFEAWIRFTCHGHQENMDRTINKLSSLDSHYTADEDMHSLRQFLKEHIDPKDSIIFRYRNMDSVYFHLDMYLRDRWEQENEEAKAFANNDFETYYNFFAGNQTPQQITLSIYCPEKYYPYIRCPILAVQGTKDERIDCYPNIERMKQLLSEGGNNNFQAIILEGYKHNLAKWNGGGYYVEDDVIHKIIKWIDKQ